MDKAMRWLPVVVLLLLAGIVFSEETIIHGLEGLRDLVLPSIQVGILLSVVLAAVLYAVGQLFGAEMRARATVYATGLFVAAILASIIYLVFVGFTNPTFIQDTIPANMRFAAPHIAASLTFALVMVMLFYILAAGLQHPPLEAIKQEELAAFILSLVLVFSWTFLDASMGTVTRGFLCTTTADLCNRATATSMGAATATTMPPLTHVDIAYYSLDILFVKLRDIYMNLYTFEVLIGFLSTISFPIGSLLPGLNIISFTFMPFDGLVLLSNAHTVVVEAIGYNMMVILAKENLLLFVRDAVPSILLPIGLMMRAFPWFRVTGSSLIAICVVAYFVFPLSVLLTNYLVFDVYKPGNFAYAPDLTSYTTHNMNADEIQRQIDERNEGAQQMLDVFNNGQAIAHSVQRACGTGIVGAACDLENIWDSVTGTVSSAFGRIRDIFLVMSRFSGDLTNVFLSNLTPIGPTGGMYNYIMLEVISASQFVVITIFASVLEIIITITMYRNISSLIGGDVEIAGLSKLV